MSKPDPSIIEGILSRRSVRSYTSEPVAREDVETLLRAGMAAPSSKNRQPWEFVVIDDRALLDTLASRLRYAKMLSGAPLALAVCGDAGNPNWQIDCSAVAENILLAAVGLGLGAVWTAAADEERSEIVSQALDLPEGIKPLCVIAVGHPAGDEQPKDKWKPEKIHYNRW